MFSDASGRGSFQGNGQPYYAGWAKPPQQNTTQSKLKETQDQVNQVIGTMQMNVDKILERDRKIFELQDRAITLQQGATLFEKQAAKCKRKYWWKNTKMIIIIGTIVLALIIVIIIVAWSQ